MYGRSCVSEGERERDGDTVLPLHTDDPSSTLEAYIVFYSGSALLENPADTFRAPVGLRYKETPTLFVVPSGRQMRIASPKTNTEAK
jgi:hypothetical protein